MKRRQNIPFAIIFLIIAFGSLLAIQDNVISATVNLTVNSARHAVNDLESLIKRTLKTEVYTAKKSTGIFNASEQSTQLGNIGKFDESLLGEARFTSYFYESKRLNRPVIREASGNRTVEIDASISISEYTAETNNESNGVLILIEVKDDLQFHERDLPWTDSDHLKITYFDNKEEQLVNIVMTMEDDNHAFDSRTKRGKYSVHLKGARHDIEEGNKWVPYYSKDNNHMFKGRVRVYEGLEFYEYHIHIPPEQAARIDWATFSLKVVDYDSGKSLSTEGLSYQIAKEVTTAKKFKYFFGSAYQATNSIILPANIGLEEAETVLSDSGFVAINTDNGILDKVLRKISSYYLSVFPVVEHDLQVLGSSKNDIGTTVRFNNRYVYVKNIKDQEEYYILFDITNDLLSNIENTIIQKILPTLLFSGIIFTISIIYILMYSKYVVIARRVHSIEAELEEKEKDLVSCKSSLETVTQLSVHELRNPLNDLSSSIQLKEKQMPNMLYESLMSDVDRITEIIEFNRVIAKELAKAKNMNITLEKHDTNIEIVVKNTAANFFNPHRSAFVGGTAFRLHVAKQSSVLKVSLNQTHFEGVLNNVFDNALGFTREIAEKTADSSVSKKIPIEIMLEESDDQIEIDIFNQGQIIPDGMIKEIFNLHESTRRKTDKGDHFGLGLWLAKIVVEAHGGDISANNKIADDNNSGGVSILIRLPKSKASC